MFTHKDRPVRGAGTAARPDRRLRVAEVESLESRQVAAISGISAEAVLGPAPAKMGGAQTVTISGTVAADGPIGTVANALIFDEFNASVPTVVPVALTPAGDGTYSYSLPLTLSTRLKKGDRDGHQYAVAISVQDRTSSVSASANFTLPAARSPVARPLAARFRTARG